MENRKGYISLAELESLGRICYEGVEKESELNHRTRIKNEGKNLLIYPSDISFVMVAKRIPGLPLSCFNHLYPNKSIGAIISNGGIIIGKRDDGIVWGEQQMDVIHMNPLEEENPRSLELIVRVTRTDSKH